jgi:hypothetical protein
MGGSSVPSSTTQTTMLDPTRQAALKKSMGYFDKWADTYKGPTYKGPLTAGRTSDWYAAQNMAHKMANRFSEGGITSVRRFDDGGLTLGSVVGPPSATSDQSYGPVPFAMTNDQVPTGYNNTYAFDNPNLTLTTVDGPISAYSNQTVTDKPQVTAPNAFAMTNDQVPTGYNNTYAFDNPNLTLTTVDGPISAYSNQTVTDKPQVTAPNAFAMTNDQVPTGYNNTYAFDNPNLTLTTVDGPISAYSNQTVTDKPQAPFVPTNDWGEPYQPAVANPNTQSLNPYDTMDATGLNPYNTKVNVADTGAGLDALKDKVNVADTGAGLDALKDKVNVADTGAGAGAATDQAVKDVALQKAITDANLTPANVTPTVTSTNMGSPYLLGQALTLGGAGSAFRLGSDVTPKQIYNSYNTPDKFTPDTWNKAAMDTYMSPYTQGVVDIALREAERQRGIERLRENTAATQSGAFGGYRQGVVEAEGERNYNQLLNDIETKGYQNAYTDAVSQFAADRAAKQAAYTANQQALQAAATGDISAGQYNQANKFQAFTNQLNALNQGVNNVQNLGALETAYQTAMGNAGAALNSTDASARASDQATIDALKQLGIDITNVDWTKAQNLSALAGLSQNNSNVQIKQSN